MKSACSSLFKRLHDLFFALSFTFAVPRVYRIPLWAAEKCLFLSTLVLSLFVHTPWDYIGDLFGVFNPFSYFSSGDNGFAAFCLVLFVALQSFLMVFAYCLMMHHNSNATWVLTLGLPLVHSVLVEVVAFLGFYLFAVLAQGAGLTFSDYKKISSTLVISMSTMHVTLCALYAVMMVEVLAIDSLCIFLFQRRRLSVTCVSSWKFELFDLFTRVTTIAVFVCDSNQNYELWLDALLGLAFLAKTVGWFWLPATREELPEFAVDLGAFMLVGFNAISTVFSMKDYYQYSLLVPVYTAMGCLVRAKFGKREIPAELKSDDDVVDYLRVILELIMSTDQASALRIHQLLDKHKIGCAKLDCGCRSITFDEIVTNWSEETKFSYKTYETGKEVPYRLTASCKLRVLGILLGDIRPALTKSPAVGLGLAEIYYYLLGNHWEALMHVQLSELSTNSLSLRQVAASLRNAIDEGINKNSEDAVNLTTTLRLQTEYFRFLSCIERSCECTVKFWTLLKEDHPDSAALICLGQEIYETSQKLFQLVRSINRASPDHLEFLFRFGLYARRILHDKVSSAYAFQRILWNTENTTMNSRKDQLMTVILSAEHQNLFTVLDVNTELEHRLGFKREELIGLPATKIMHARIAKQHQGLAMKYFKSMKGDMLKMEKPEFFRHQEGYVLPCRETKRLVPDMTQGLRGVMLIYPDPTASSYTAQRTDPVRKKTGAFLCDDKGRITEYTREAEEMGLHKEVLVAGTTLQLVFPELRDERILEFVSRPKGAVLLFNPSSGNEESSQDDTGESNGANANQRPENRMLIWVRVVKEKCGEEDQLVVLFSLIQKAVRKEYVPHSDFAGKVFKRIDKALRSPARNFTPKHATNTGTVTPTSARNYNFEVGTEQSQSGSAESGSFGSIGTQSTTSQDVLMKDEMQQQASGRDTPNIIKRLAVVLGIFLVLSVTLIVVETLKFTNEAVDLRDRFQMIEYFTIRYEIMIYMSSCPINYDTYRRVYDAATFAMYCVRARARADRGAAYNVLVKKSFTKFGMEYDYDKITIRVGSDSYSASYDYAFPNYINRIMTYTSLNVLSIAKYCPGNYTAPVCLENNLALDYCNANGMPTMLPYQTKVSKLLITDLLRIAVMGRDSLYILIGVCIAVVVSSSLIILVLLIWVIKGKSKVMAIFAEILPEEVDSIITQAQHMNIADAHFDQKYVTMCENNEEKFWHFFFRRKHAHNPAGKAAEEKAGTPSGSKDKLVGENEDAEKGEEEEESKSDDPEKEMNEEKQKLEQEKARLEKQELKRCLLGQIDSRLRNRSMLKLAAILFLFLINTPTILI